jgi:hypothetical protein
MASNSCLWIKECRSVRLTQKALPPSGDGHSSNTSLEVSAFPVIGPAAGLACSTPPSPIRNRSRAGLSLLVVPHAPPSLTHTRPNVYFYSTPCCHWSAVYPFIPFSMARLWGAPEPPPSRIPSLPKLPKIPSLPPRISSRLLEHKWYIAGGAGALATVLLLSSLRTAPRPLPILSPKDTLLPNLDPAELKELPYPPDALPGARDVDTPYGSIRVYEWGPEKGDKVLLIHGISTPSVALAGVANRLVRKGGCRVMLFGMLFLSLYRSITSSSLFCCFYPINIVLACCPVLIISPLSAPFQITLLEPL